MYFCDFLIIIITTEIITAETKVTSMPINSRTNILYGCEVRNKERDIIPNEFNFDSNTVASSSITQLAETRC